MFHAKHFILQLKIRFQNFLGQMPTKIRRQKFKNCLVEKSYIEYNNFIVNRIEWEIISIYYKQSSEIALRKWFFLLPPFGDSGGVIEVYLSTPGAMPSILIELREVNIHFHLLLRLWFWTLRMKIEFELRSHFLRVAPTQLIATVSFFQNFDTEFPRSNFSGMKRNTIALTKTYTLVLHCRSLRFQTVLLINMTGSSLALNLLPGDHIWQVQIQLERSYQWLSISRILLHLPFHIIRR